MSAENELDPKMRQLAKGGAMPLEGADGAPVRDIPKDGPPIRPGASR